MAIDRASFNTKSTDSGEFNQLLGKPKKNKKKEVEISGDFDFTDDAFFGDSNKNEAIDTQSNKSFPTVGVAIESSNTEIKSNQRGRPITIKDLRYKVCKPKMISPALESKLSVLQDYVEEFQSISGRITFEKYIDTLLESYIKSKLGIAKEERLREEIKEAFEELKK